MSSLDNFLASKLQQRSDDRSLRKLKQSTGQIDFTSNDYLGLARSIELYDEVSRKIESLGLKYNGATGSRLLSGNSAYTEMVERTLSGIFKSEAALIINSGYCANTAVLSSIPQKGDTIVYDELAHASIKDGARLSLANRFSFKHNDLDELERKLKISTGKKFIAIESIYSMDGDASHLSQFIALAEQYDASIILDEAHSTGVLGEKGGGLAVSLGLEHKIAIRIYTFGKAMGCHGACIAGSKNLIDYLINFARPFIYTTALPVHTVATIACSFAFLSHNIYLQDELRKNITTFTSALKNPTSQSAIQAVIVPGNENAKKIAETLQKDNFDVRPVLSPTVPKGAERLRICLHTYNTEAEILQLANRINTLKQTHRIE